MLLSDTFEWDDITIFTEKAKAIEISIKYPNARVEIFNKTTNGYKPSHFYYKNGELLGGSKDDFEPLTIGSQSYHDFINKRRT